MTSTQDITVLVCGFFTIRSPAFVVKALCLIVLVTIPPSFFGVQRTSRFLPEIEQLIAFTFYAFRDSLVALALLLCLLRARRGLHFESDTRLCPTCGYDLRGITSLTCTECGRCFAPLDFYDLVGGCSMLIVRSLGVALLVFGIAEIASRLDLILDAFRVGLGVRLAGDVPSFDAIGTFPSLSAGISQLVEGSIATFCGVAIMRSPKLMLRACCVALAVSALQSSVEYLSVLNSLGRSYPDIAHRMGWFMESFLPPIHALVVLAAIYPIRRKLGTLGLQRPLCRYCGALMIDPQSLNCTQCGQGYSPSEFAQLEPATYLKNQR